VATAAHLDAPTGLAIAASTGNVYVSDTGNTYVRVVDGNGAMKNKIFAFAGTQGKAGFSGDGGTATSAKLNNPTGLASDPLGNVYISDTSNQRIRLVNPSNIISTYAGTGVAGYSGDGGPATSAKLDNPTGDVAADGSAVYFGDTTNNVVRGIFNGPPPILPQTVLAIVLPISAVALGVGAVTISRRRNRRLEGASVA
jgi:DNA-binding beta-propeller fold protein YncE